MTPIERADLVAMAYSLESAGIRQSSVCIRAALTMIDRQGKALEAAESLLLSLQFAKIRGFQGETELALALIREARQP